MDPYTTLLKRIKQGDFAVGARIDSERALAEDLQASRAIVRKAIARLAEEGWLDVKHGCRPVVRAQASGRSRARTVALLIGSETSYRPFAQILRACEVELRKQDCLLVFMDTWAETSHNSEDRGRREQETLDYIAEQGISGVILWCQEPEFALSRLLALGRRGVKVVTIDRAVPGAELDHIGIDNFRAAGSVVDYLVQANHRNIVFAAALQDHASTVQQRIEGFYYALHRNGLESSEASLLRFPLRASSDQIATELRLRQDAGALPTAIFAMNDFYAKRVIRALRSLELRVPEDVSVVGFDDMESGSEEEPVLTTVRQPFADIGHIAVRTLLQRIEEPNGPALQILLPTELIERRSVRTLDAAMREDKMTTVQRR